MSIGEPLALLSFASLALLSFASLALLLLSRATHATIKLKRTMCEGEKRLRRCALRLPLLSPPPLPATSCRLWNKIPQSAPQSLVPLFLKAPTMACPPVTL
jgi:hypothetical protein